MKRPAVRNGGALLMEGTGGAYVPPRQVAVERAGSNPFSNLLDPIAGAMRNWLSASNRLDEAVLLQFRKVMLSYSPQDIRDSLKANFHGSDREELKEVLVISGIAKQRNPKERVEIKEDSETDTAESLLREAVFYTPIGSEIRERVSRFLENA
jgi:hypothetical protein